MNVSIVSACSFSWKEHIGKIAFDNFQGYCNRNGYQFRGMITTDPRVHYTNWEKLELARTELRRLAADDVVMVLDADLLITNWGVRVEWFIDEAYSLFITQDCNSINAGAMIFRRSAAGMNLLDLIIELHPKYTCEQNAIEELMRDRVWNSQISVLGHPSINSYIYSEYGMPNKTHKEGNWQPGDFILHIPARSIERRIEIMNSTPIWK